MKKTLALLALAVSTPLLAADPAPRTAFPAWLAGAWEQRDGDAWSDEFWTPPRGELMIGAARTGRGGQLQSFEHTRIVRKPDGSLSFVAQPGGGAATEFPMHETGPEFIEFVNATHDYPQRIRYSRKGNLLMAEISRLDGSDLIRWNFRPMGEP